MDDKSKLKQINLTLKGVIEKSFGKVDRMLASVIDGDEVLGVFQRKKEYYSFEISAKNKLSYELIQFKSSRSDSYRADSYRADGVLLKKKCKKGVQCGSSCIPKGTVCSLGLPTAEQAKVAAVRKVYKGSSKLARLAGKIALATGTAMVGAYLAKKAQDPKVQQKVSNALKSVGADSQVQKKIQGLVSNISSQVKDKTGIQVPDVQPYKKLTPMQNLQLKAREAVREYTDSWKYAPGKTAMKHLSAGVLLISAEQLGERLGYIPEGTLEKNLNANAVKEKVGAGVDAVKNKFSKKKPYTVNSRTTSYGG